MHSQSLNSSEQRLLQSLCDSELWKGLSGGQGLQLSIEPLHIIPGNVDALMIASINRAPGRKPSIDVTRKGNKRGLLSAGFVPAIHHISITALGLQDFKKLSIGSLGLRLH